MTSNPSRTILRLCLLSLPSTASLLLLSNGASAQFPMWQASGTQAGGRFGYAVANVSDIDGDGFDDFLVGAPTGASESPDSIPSPLAPGHAYIVSGTTGQTIFDILGSGIAGDCFGYSVAALGDTNLDGVGDFGVGAVRQSSAFDPAAGSLSVYSGATGALRFRLFGDAPNDYYGAAVAGLGDVNIDGVVDFVVGAPFADPSAKTNAGRVKVCVGATGSTLKTVNGQFAGDLFGSAIAATSDFTNDLNNDFVVGAPLALDLFTGLRLGRVTLFEGGGTFFAKVNGLGAGDRFGRSVSSIPDFDGDGRNDIVVGAIAADGPLADSGSVTIISTKPLTPVLFTKFGTQSNAAYGIAVRGVADLNHDNVPDLLVSDMQGRVQVLSGTGTQLGMLTGSGGFGRAIAVGSDVNGDGVPDLAIASPNASALLVDQSGTVQLIPGPALIGSVAIDDASPVTFSVALGQSVTPVTRKLVDIGFSSVEFDVVVPANAPWLHVSPANGALSQLADSVLLTFSLGLSSLPNATSNTAVSIVNHVTGKTMVNLTVNVVPTSAGASSKLHVVPSSLYAVAPFGSSPPESAIIEVQNGGNPALLLAGTIGVEPASATWLVPSVTSFQLAPNQSGAAIELDYATQSLAPGKYEASVVIANTFDPNDTVSIPVTVLVGTSLFSPGNRLKGTLADVSDRDEAVFLGIEGLAVEFIGGPKKNGAAPRFTLIDPTGVAFDTWVPANAKTKKGFLLNQAGPWILRVESENGSIGDYDLKTKRDGLPANAKSFAKTVTATSAEAFEVPFAALPDCHLDATITAKTLPIGQLAFALKAPNGATFDASQFDSIGAKTFSYTKLPLAAAGTWRLAISGLQNGAQIKLDFALKQPKPGKTTLTID